MTFSTLSSSSEVGEQFIIITTTKLLAVSGGYILRVEKDITIKPGALILAETLLPFVSSAIQYAASTVPADVVWSQISVDDTSTGNARVERKTFSGSPVDGLDNPIGSGAFYRTDTTFYNNDDPQIGATTTLTWRPS